LFAFISNFHFQNVAGIVCFFVLFLSKKFINYIQYQLTGFPKRPSFSLCLKFAKVVSAELDGKMPSLS